MTDYQCVLIGETWHLTQEQAIPPSVLRDGAWTSCAVWANFVKQRSLDTFPSRDKRGYNRRRPDCQECLQHVVQWEARYVDIAPDVVTVPPT